MAPFYPYKDMAQYGSKASLVFCKFSLLVMHGKTAICHDSLYLLETVFLQLKDL